MRYLPFLLAIVLSACVTASGNYTVTATKSDGTPVQANLTAQGSGIYIARNALCEAYPGATVRIIDTSSGEEYAAESPYQCT